MKRSPGISRRAFLQSAAAVGAAAAFPSIVPASAQEPLTNAIEAYRAAYRSLSELAAMFPMASEEDRRNSREDNREDAAESDAGGLRSRTLVLLREAKAAEAQGVKALGKVVLQL